MVVGSRMHPESVYLIRSPNLSYIYVRHTLGRLFNWMTNAVTGLNITYEAGLEIGRKINNLERAILVLNGRNRDEEYFPPFSPYNSYVYTNEEPFLQNFKAGGNPPDTYTVFRDGMWMEDVTNFPLDKAKMDAFKTLYYKLEGWDTATGAPTRKALEQAGCKAVADELATRGKLPA